MTEEQKQALIEWLKPQIDELQNVSDEIPFGLDSDSAMHLNTMRVALAALTSPPMACKKRLVNHRSGVAHHWTYHGELDRPSSGDIFRVEVVPLYEHPAPAADLAELAELVPMEWTNEQCMEFLSIAFRHAQISGDMEMDDIRQAVKMVNAGAKNH